MNNADGGEDGKTSVASPNRGGERGDEYYDLCAGESEHHRPARLQSHTHRSRECQRHDRHLVNDNGDGRPPRMFGPVLRHKEPGQKLEVARASCDRLVQGQRPRQDEDANRQAHQASIHLLETGERYLACPAPSRDNGHG